MEALAAPEIHSLRKRTASRTVKTEARTAQSGESSEIWRLQDEEMLVRGMRLIDLKMSVAESPKRNGTTRHDKAREQKVKLQSTQGHEINETRRRGRGA
ncbi:hypothetical protein ERJ75_001268600 [Trypanosoma vivax]|nr:hypothetical protein ERJ75_001268600 [Trypanosoma vivax]